MNPITFSLKNLDIENQDIIQSCRFIPSRNNLSRLNLDSPRNQLSPRNSIDSINDENKYYKALLKKNLNIQQKQKTQQKLFTVNTLENLECFDIPKKKVFQGRNINKAPFKVLDAPFLQDDYYLNVVDWSKSNDLAVALGPAIYTWNFDNNTISKVTQNEEENFFSSISFNTNNNLLSTGALNGQVQVHDIVAQKQVIKIQDHIERVGAITFHDNLLISGSRDNCLFLYDIRTPQKPIHFYDFHTQEVCGVKWNPEGDYFASGGNDNKLFVFTLKMPIPVYKKNHKAAVKALGWSYLRRGILATGAGTADRCLRIFDINTKKIIEQKDTGSQICNLKWSKKEDEIITAHGFNKNDVCVWRRKGLKKIATLKGHSQRVLYLANNWEGNIMVSGAGDETLRFWNLGYDQPKNIEIKNDSFMMQVIR